MAVVDFNTNEVVFKLVFDGAAGAGKRTTLEAVRKQLPEDSCSELTMRPAGSDTVAALDFFPPELDLVRGLRTRFRLTALTGPVECEGTRELLLRGADGVIFTLDSDPGRREDNLHAFEMFSEHVRGNRRNPETIPLVFQCNKRDVPGAVSLRELGQTFNTGRVDRMAVETVAAKGDGVLECLDTVTAEVLRRFEIHRHRFPELGHA